jgi:hypothetical protein
MRIQPSSLSPKNPRWKGLASTAKVHQSRANKRFSPWPGRVQLAPCPLVTPILYHQVLLQSLAHIQMSLQYRRIHHLALPRRLSLRHLSQHHSPERPEPAQPHRKYNRNSKSLITCRFHSPFRTRLGNHLSSFRVPIRQCHTLRGRTLVVHKPLAFSSHINTQRLRLVNLRRMGSDRIRIHRGDRMRAEPSSRIGST